MEVNPRHPRSALVSFLPIVNRTSLNLCRYSPHTAKVINKSAIENPRHLRSIISIGMQSAVVSIATNNPYIMYPLRGFLSLLLFATMISPPRG